MPICTSSGSAGRRAAGTASVTAWMSQRSAGITCIASASYSAHPPPPDLFAMLCQPWRRGSLNGTNASLRYSAAPAASHQLRQYASGSFILTVLTLPVALRACSTALTLPPRAVAALALAWRLLVMG